MQLSLALMENIATMLIWVLVGYIAVKSGLVKGEGSKVLSSLTVYVFCPCMIFNAFQIELTRERIFGFLSCVAFAFVAFVLWIVLSRLLRRPLGLSPVDETSLVYGNVGNLVLPLVQLTLGDEMVFYASALQIPFNLLFWTHGISVMQGSAKFEWKKIVSNANIWAVLFGLVFLGFQWHLPSVLETSVTGLAHMVAPASMMVIGMVLAGTSLKSIFTTPRAYAIALGKLVLYPLIPILLLYVSGLLRHYPDLVPVLMVTAIAFAAPAASNVSQLAVVFDQEPEKASIYNILTLFFCVITIPLFIGLYQLLFS
ncbi:MAG: AEC family transporter [Clostridia bacterium]|nr:AEC family transporter [Clostridia bacterium]